MTTTNESPGNPNNNSEPLRFGILGAARIAPKALVAPAEVIDTVAITHIAARDRARAEAFATEHAIANVVDTYQAVVDAPDVDVIYNPLPMNLHAEWTIKALEAGKHVLCEKPFASNAAEATEMVAAAERTGRVLGEAFHYYYHPFFTRLVEVVRSGVLGTIEHIEAAFSVAIAKPDLRWSYETSGGSLMDLGCYPVSWVRMIAGEEPEIVDAVAVEGPEHIDASIEANLRFASGATGSVRSSMVDPFDAFVRVTGTNGSLFADNPLAPQAGNRLEITTDAGRTALTMPAGDTYEHMLRCFVDHVTHGLPFPTKGTDSINNMATIDAIYQAAGLPVRGNYL